MNAPTVFIEDEQLESQAGCYSFTETIGDYYSQTVTGFPDIESVKEYIKDMGLE